MLKIFLGLVFLSVVLVGCGGMDIDKFEATSPRLVMEEYFEGKTRAWGIFEDRFGTLRRQFTVDIDGHWDGRTLTLTNALIIAMARRIGEFGQLRRSVRTAMRA